MNKFLIVLGITLLLILLYFLYNKETKWIKSELDDHYYLIKNNKLSNKELIANANTLAEINRRITILINNSGDKYPKLRELYNKANLSEAAIDNRYTTFTVDKRDIHVCLRTRNENQELYDINLLMYVIIHELAHMANWDYKTGHPIIGHGKEFVGIFRDLLSKSITLGIYTYEDYSKYPKEYCGLIIHSNVHVL